MSAQSLSNLLNLLQKEIKSSQKRDIMLRKPHFFSLFRNEFNKLDNTRS